MRTYARTHVRACGLLGASLGLEIAFFLMLLGWVFVPAYLAASVYTMPEYMSKRFGGRRLRAYLTIVSLLLYVFTKVSVTLYAGGKSSPRFPPFPLWGRSTTISLPPTRPTLACGMSLSYSSAMYVTSRGRMCCRLEPYDYLVVVHQCRGYAI